MQMLVNYDSVAPDFERRYQEQEYSGVSRALTKFLALPVSDSRLHVLDVGCGTGHWLRFLRDGGAHRVVGVDASFGMLQVARSLMSAAPLAHARAEALPVASRQFDFVVC